MHHYRVDGEHSNSYEIWKKMGSPQKPTDEQYRQLESAGQLHMLASPEWRTTKNGQLKVRFQLPRQGVSLLNLSW
jgi:xylan 1,4-beta-xylosidase